MSAVDWSPLLHLLLIGGLLAGPVLLWLWLRHRQAPLSTRLRALAWLTAFLTFDLIVVGAFTRLTDSGLGCPDWPGCYGHASPVGARDHIAAAEAALPTGPVTWSKAWIEMLHRYLATGVGALITALAAGAWVAARRRGAGYHGPSPGWAAVALAWVCAQGAFGALTVTLRLYPLIVTLHLLGGLGLLVVLCALAQRGRATAAVPLPRHWRAAAAGVFALCAMQAALGGWVSANYAVLACSGFPACNGQWWPAMDFRLGFTLMRPLGLGPDGGFLPHDALVAIHWVHRAAAFVVLTAITVLGVALARHGEAAARRWGRGLLALAAWQMASGLGNVVLGWPIPAALAHSAGAAALLALLTSVLVRSAAPASQPHRLRAPAEPGHAVAVRTGPA